MISSNFECCEAAPPYVSLIPPPPFSVFSCPTSSDLMGPQQAQRSAAGKKNVPKDPSLRVRLAVFVPLVPLGSYYEVVAARDRVKQQFICCSTHM